MKKTYLFVGTAMLTIVLGYHSAQSGAMGTQSDSLHYLLSPRQVQWSEDESGYIATVEFSLQWDEPNDTLRGVIFQIEYREYALELIEVRAVPEAWLGRFYMNEESLQDGVRRVQYIFDGVTAPTPTLFLKMCDLDFKIVDTFGIAPLRVSFHKSQTGNQSSVNGSLVSPYDANYEDAELWTTSVEQTPCCDIPGDSDSNGVLEIGDVTHLIRLIFNSDAILKCRSEGDSNGDGNISILDITYTIQSIFAAGPQPVCAE